MPTPDLLELLPRCDRPDFTPGRKDFPILLSAFAEPDADLHKRVTRALARALPASIPPLAAALATATPPVRARLTRALGRLVADTPHQARTTIETHLGDPDEHTRRAAIQAIATWKDLDPATEARLEAQLLALWPTEPLPSQRALIRTLGRIGTAPTAALLARPLPADPELTRLAAEASLIIARRTTRNTASRLDPTRPLPAPVVVRANCKPGLESFLQKELSRHAKLPLTPPNHTGFIRFPFHGRLADLYTARTMADLALELPSTPLGAQSPATALATALAAPATQAIFRTLTVGQTRYRLTWSGAGKRKADTLACVAALATLAPAMVNDPSTRLWDIEATVAGTDLDVRLIPLFDDPRFVWRVRDVPASSHPTLAAALVQLAGITPTDHVWDPFAGSGLELVERAIQGPFARLVGTDIDPAAIASARANLQSAGVTATMALAAAEAFDPGPVDAIISNPPLGGRVGDQKSVQRLMAAFIPHAAAHLKPGGRMAWLTRNPRETDPLLTAAGLMIVSATIVDLGGVIVTMQRVEKPRRRR